MTTHAQSRSSKNRRRETKTNRVSEIFHDGAWSILESISDGVFTVDEQWRITSFNRAAEQITGIPRRDAIGKLCSDVFRASMCETDCALRHTVRTGRPVIDKPVFIVNTQGRRIPVSVSTAVLRDARGRRIGGAETFRDMSLVEDLRKELKEGARAGDLASCSRAMRPVFDLLPLMAASSATVLIRGETGTGKELLARAIHDLGPRAKKPFIAVHCGALPDTLLESELFGYVKGAFTGADRDKPGRFERAEGGTLFLDEIGDISPALQVRLLRVLQERTYEPLGGTQARQADVRIIAATHLDLNEQTREGAFREDLFYRLNVVPVALPPLRERREDIPLLTQQFIDQFNRRQGTEVTGIEPEALALLMAHDFPGNIRELENVVERAFVLCRTGLIGRVHLPPELAGTRPARSHSGSDERLADQTQAAQMYAIRDALERTEYNRTAAAHHLGIHKSTLYRKIRASHIALPKRDGRSSSQH